MGKRNNCKRCKYWEANQPNDKGLCRRYPPIAKVGGIIDVNVTTDRYDWCGEFKETPKNRKRI